MMKEDCDSEEKKTEFFEEVADNIPKGEPSLKTKPNASHSNRSESPPLRLTTLTMRPKSLRRPSVPRSLSLMVRTLCCDIPMLLVLLAYFSLLWLSHVHENYLSEQIKAMYFSDQRREEEITYYTRPCSGEDITAKNGADLFLSKNATVEEAYQHQLKHGFTVFPGVLSRETAAALRQHVVERNTFNTSDSESIFVIENNKRYSFGLETSYPVVANAMMEIATHPLLRPSLEKILGKNPALIEMTAITSSFGAADQYWHDDVIPTASAIRYARTFGPSYSVFIQLQNTTGAMGATDACPGTHYCSAAGVDEVCEDYGFQMVGKDGYWHAGDALLMNMNSYHRGKAHTDPHGMDRVMLILTFTTRPRTRGETRQLSQGITFSLRWDEWGHTLNDMARADKIMQKPWTYLRALGLFKLPGTDWGIDYVTSASMRMSNEDNGFREDELEVFMERGGIWWLPSFLQGEVEDDESWHEYYLDTGKRCLSFIRKILLPACVSGYLVLFSFFGLTSSKEDLTANSRNAAARLSLLGFTVYALYSFAVWRVDGTDWARDVRNKKRHWGVFQHQRAFGISSQGPSTLPHRRDVLIENRYGSDFLAMYEEFIDGHPGNRVFNQIAAGVNLPYKHYPEFLKNASAHYLQLVIKDNNGRFLYQGPTGAWEWLSDEKSVAFVRRHLDSNSHPAKRMLTRRIRHLVSDCMYGLHSRTKMAQRHILPQLKKLERTIIGGNTSVKYSQMNPTIPVALFKPHVPLATYPILAKRVDHHQRFPFPPKREAAEPEAGAWLTEGSLVECLEDDEYWYPATISHISAHAEYFVRWASGMDGKVEFGYVRPFTGYQVGTELELYGDDFEEALDCTVIRANKDGTYDVELDEDESLRNGVDPAILRRPAEDSDLEVATYNAAY